MRLRPQGPVALVGLAIALLGVGEAAAQDVNLNIGDLPPGKKVVVTFRATVDSLTDQVLPDVDNTGTVNATNLGAPVATNTASTTLDSLTLSDQIFQDNDGSGTFNAGDTGIVGVALTLLQGATPIATTTSLAGGIYAFTGLAPGDYAVRVDASNFAAAAVLDGLSSVLGASDPDNNVDNDDNGVDDASPEVNGITSLPITLAYNAETVADGTGQLDINDTLDFGFVQGPDIEITKAESIDPVIAGSGTGNLVYTITAKNNGPVAATGLAVTETLTLPAGVTVDTAVPSSGTSVSGIVSPITWTIGNLANGAMETLTVTLTVAPNAAAGTDVISDTAAVSALNEPDSDTSNDSATEATSVAREVDIRVEKAGVPDPSIVAGSSGGTDNLVYTVTVTNDGPSDATGVEIDDALTLPAGVAVSTTTPPAASQGTFTAPDWSVGDLANGASATLTITLDVTSAAAAGATITNVASFDSTAGGETETGAGANSATVNTTVARQIDIRVEKAGVPDPDVVAGASGGVDNLVHTVTVTNDGPSDATGIEVSDVLSLPTGVAVSTTTPPSASQGSFTAPTWTVGDLASGASATLTLTLDVGSDAVAGATIGNVATFVSTTGGETETGPGANSATVNTNVTREVDLEVTKTESLDPAIAGSGAGNLIYMVTVKNNGPSDATGVELSEDLTLPAGVSVDSVAPSGTGTFATTTAPDGTWTVGDLAAGDMETLTVTLTVGAATVPGTDVVANTATVTAVTEDLVSPDTTPDSATEATSVATQADLAVTKSDDVDPVAAGGTLVYTVTVDNLGPSDAQNVVVTDTLPGLVTLVATSGCAEDPNGVPTCTLGTIAAGSSDAFTVTVTVATPVPAGVGLITNSASVASDTTDPNGANDDTTENTAIDAAPDLEITKDDGGVTSFPGGVIAYGITFNNIGNQGATGVKVVETVPANTTFNEAASGGAGVWSCADGAPATTVCEHIAGGVAGSGPATIAGIAGGTGINKTTFGGKGKGKGSGPAAPTPSSVTFAVTVDPAVILGTTREIANTATVEDDGANGTDPDASNNTAMDTTPLPVDFGDAPDPLDATAGSYATLLASNGPRHVIRPTGDPLRIFLGASVDDDSDGQPSPPLTPAPDGDDTDLDGDDEDGVVFPNGVTPGANITVEVTASAAGLLNAWVDFDADGVFDPGDQVFTDQPLVAGLNVLVFAAPGGAFATPTAALLEGTFARFRFDTTGGLGPTGQAADGEVEDYFVDLVEDADLEIELTQSDDRPEGGSVQLYTAKVSNNGPGTARDVVATIQLPAGSDVLGVFSDPGTTCTVDTAVPEATCDLGDFAPSDMQTVELGVRLDPRRDGDLGASAEVTGTIATDPVPGNETSDVTTSVVRGQDLAEVIFTEGATTRRVLGVTLREGDESVVVGMYDTATGANLGYHVSGPGERPVAIAGLDDVSGVTGSGDPAADFAVLSQLFGGGATIRVIDADTQDTEVAAALAGTGELVPIDLAVVGNFAGSPAPELAIAVWDRGDFLGKILLVDGGSLAVLRAHAFPRFPLALVASSTFLDTPADDLISVNALAAFSLRAVDADTGTAVETVFADLDFPLDLSAPIEGIEPEVGVLRRRPSDGSLRTDVVSPLTGTISATKLFDPTTEPGSIVSLPSYGDTATGEVGVLARAGSDLSVEIQDAAVAGGVLDMHSLAMPPATLIPLDLLRIDDLFGTPAADLVILSNAVGGDSMVEVIDADSGVVALTIPLP